MAKTNNRYIIKRRHKKLKKRFVFLFIIIFVSSIIFVVKSEFFCIKKVSISGNPVMSGEEVKKNTDFLIGQNIFLINEKDIINEAKKSAYVNSVTIKRKLPKQVDINITEVRAYYYINDGNTYYVLSSTLSILEKTQNIENRNLIELKGIDLDNTDIGSLVIENDRIKTFFNIFSKIVDKNPTQFDISSIDLTDLASIKIYIGDIEGRIGNDENIPDKMNKIMHIIQDPRIGIKKGYIDVGFDGSPVYFSE
ncbi:FtsQ-type POTRA domain-containing protein [Clostridium sp. BJN0001]|uniref:cell division protein FtsQ/DivIB n=1 Tax=Clostridium sp. BJN0001 TaxID=2930219 RepID=UPI001FD51B42|nr:FtsQ-type POTRA domain-containing protein [Clostridium sp. BJN0001]